MGFDSGSSVLKFVLLAQGGAWKLARLTEWDEWNTELHGYRHSEHESAGLDARDGLSVRLSRELSESRHHLVHGLGIREDWGNVAE